LVNVVEFRLHPHLEDVKSKLPKAPSKRMTPDEVYSPGKDNP
jgi:hypothetical protein